MPKSRTSNDRCSFCGKPQNAIERLIAGPGGVYICNECVHLCEDILAEELPPAGMRRGLRSDRLDRTLVFDVSTAHEIGNSLRQLLTQHEERLHLLEQRLQALEERNDDSNGQH